MVLRAQRVIGLFVLYSGDLKGVGWVALVPVWVVVSTVFWLWAGRYLLHGTIQLRELLPGALLASLLIGGTIATSRYFLGPWLNSAGEHFGSFGVVGALLAWGFILVTISIACIVFSPVWAEWRASERAIAP